MRIEIKNSRTQYGLIARLLHWSSVAMLLTLIVIASQFADQDPGSDKRELITRHASLGLIFLVLMLTRLLWRNLNQNPIHSYSLQPWQKLAALSLHRSIYVILLAQCVLGLLILLSSGEAVHFFDWLAWPPLFAKADALHETVRGLHYLVSVMIYPLFAVHITAAIYHQIFGLVEEHA